jgi:MFS family permease
VEAFDWRAVFVFNLPPILLALALAPRAVARTRPLEARGPLDLAGAALLVVVLGGAAVLLESADDTAPALVVAVGVALAALLWIFVRLELRHPDPVVQPRFFESREFSAASFCVGTGNLALYGVVVAVPLAFSAHAGWEADEIGAVLAAATVTIAVFAGVGGRAVSRWGCRVVGFAGGAAFALGLVPLAVAGTDLSRLELAAALALAGVGAGLATTVTRMAALEALDARDAGSASGIFLTARYFGAIVATSLVGIAGGAAGAGDAAWQALFVGCLASAALSALAALALSDTGRVAALAR